MTTCSMLDDYLRFAISGASASTAVAITNVRAHLPLASSAPPSHFHHVHRCFSAPSFSHSHTRTQPLDVVKVRLQLHTGQRPGLAATLARIVRDEGPRSLMRGVGPAIVRASTYGSLRLGMYEPIKRQLAALDANACSSPAFLVKIAAGASSGASAALLTNPIEMLKVRAQSSTQHRAASAANAPEAMSSLRLARDIWTHEGPSAFGRGLAASMQRSAVLTASQIACYDHIKTTLRSSLHLPDSDALRISVAFLCGLVTTTLTSPFDVVKTRMMNQGRADGGSLPQYNGSTWRCAAHIVRVEGPLALLRGWSPNFLRQGPQTVIILCMTEALLARSGLSAL
jgi:hypothetical protein